MLALWSVHPANTHVPSRRVADESKLSASALVHPLLMVALLPQALGLNAQIMELSCSRLLSAANSGDAS